MRYTKIYSLTRASIYQEAHNGYFYTEPAPSHVNEEI